MMRLLLTVALVLIAAPAWATFPTVAATNSGTDVASDTNHVINLPASIASGDLLIIGHWGSATDSAPNTACTGWTLLRDQIVNSSVGHFATFYRIADGGEGSTVTCTTDLSELSAHVSIRVTNWHGTTPPEASAGAIGISTTPDPDTLTPSWGAADTLYIVMVGVDLAGDVTAYPANYGDNNVTPSNSGQGDAGMATRDDLNATSENPGTFTQDDGTARWAAVTIGVRPGAAAATVQRGTLLGVGP